MNKSTPLTTGTANGLAQLFERANSAHRACNASFGRTLSLAIEAGEALNRAKALCRHGEWTAQLAAHFSGSRRTSQIYMRLAKHRATIEAKSADSALLAIGSATKLIATPKAAQVDQVDEADPIPTDKLDLAAAEIHVAFGRLNDGRGACIQLEASRLFPGYWLYDVWPFDDGQTVTSMRPVRLDIVGVDLVLESLQFTRISQWHPLAPEKAVIPLINEDVRRRAWQVFTLERRTASFAEALALAADDSQCANPVDHRRFTKTPTSWETSGSLLPLPQNGTEQKNLDGEITSPVEAKSKRRVVSSPAAL